MTEADLIWQAKQGDEKAFTEIFTLYKLPLYYFILRRIRNETDAEDLVMETFERAFASIKYFVPLVKLNTWLHEIARNRVIDFVRQKNRTPQMAELDYTVRDNHTPDRICIYNQEYKIIQDGIATIKNDASRKVMIMYCQEYKMREIALELHISMDRVRNYIHNNKLKLKKLVA